ncbi:MAG: hypothetical protein HKN41_09510 [Ilumatobacter sp.]|nr:hypothetical protein [Ilumatobacter sp.]
MTRRHRPRRIFRSAALAITASAVGVAQAASLGGIAAGSIDAWNLPLEVDTGDSTPPTISATSAPAPNPFGWNDTAVTVTFVCDDAESGVASCSGPVTVSTEGQGQIVTGTAVDVEGNSASISVALNIDLTGPVVDIVGFDDGDVLQTTPSVTCTAADGLSGLFGPCTITTTPGTTTGEFVVTATASDYAGNVTVVTEHYRLLAICGNGPTNVPCVVPLGFVLDDDLEWNADVLVLGEVTGEIEVEDGNVTVGSTGVVGDDIEQSGSGGVTVAEGGIVDGTIEEEGPGSVIVDGVVLDDVSEEGDGDLAIGPDAYVDGTVEESGPGSLTVAGAVERHVREEDDGDLVVAGSATVGGHVTETGPGSVVVAGHVDGRVRERGAGSVTVDGRVDGDVEERDDGDLTIGATAVLARRANEHGDGSMFVLGSVVGDVIERGAGDLAVHAGASLGRNAEERNDGHLTVDGPSSIGRDVDEAGTGDMTIGADVVVGRHADSGGGGTCTVSPLATIGGNLRNACAE